jgi:predicted O-methyltransferase YrrM
MVEHWWRKLRRAARWATAAPADRALMSYDRHIYRAHRILRGALAAPVRAERFPAPPQLDAERLGSARLLPDRLSLLGVLPRDALVCEVGTFRGEFAAAIAQVCRPARLHLVDITFRYFREELLPAEYRGERLIRHEGPSAQILGEFPAGAFDWIYIDADHTAPAVLEDARLAARALRPDGILVFNDYIQWSHLDASRYDVIEAVNRLCLEADFELLYLALHPQMYCDVAIRRRSAGSPA